MSDQKWFSISECEKKIRIPASTIRRYINHHGHHLHIRKQGKSYLVESDSLHIMGKIRDMYERGKKVEYVEDVLRKMNVPMTITVDDGEKDVSVTVSESLLQLKKDMVEQRKGMNEQQQIIHKQNELLASLVKKLDEQQEYMSQQQEQMKQHQENIDKRLEERDTNLMQSLKESMETKQEKKGFWSKIFNS